MSEEYDCPEVNCGGKVKKIASDAPQSTGAHTSNRIELRAQTPEYKCRKCGTSFYLYELVE